MTIGHQPSDTKLIRVRGPLANSSVDVDTYTAYIRPFYDEANNIGQLTLFSQPTTIYTLNGVGYVGNAGLNALSVLSAGSTMTAGFTTFQPDYNPLNGAYRGPLQSAVRGRRQYARGHLHQRHQRRCHRPQRQHVDAARRDD